MTCSRPRRDAARARTRTRLSIPCVAATRATRTLLAASMAAVLAACGGGGGGGSSPTAQNPAPPVAAPAPAPGPAPAPAPAPAAAITFSGTAATGAAMVGAVVRVVDAGGNEVGRSAPVGADGRYEVRLADGARAPFVVVAALDDGESHVSVFPRAESSTVNVTPITSLIAARLSSDGTPQGLVTDFRSAGAKPVPTPAAVEAARDQVTRAIAPVAQAVGDRSDPVTGAFGVGGTGHDKVLDSLAITITPREGGGSHIEIAVRTRRDESAPMPVVTFASTAPTVPAVPAVAAADLVATGTSARIDALVELLNRCYALPLADRVDGSAAVPAAIRPGPCRTMYWRDDPSTYLHGGAQVGRGAADALFAGTRLAFDRPVYEYTRRADEAGSPELVVFSVRWTNPDTAASDTLVVVAREEDRRLKLFGDQYAHPMSVRAWAEQAHFLREDSRALDYVTTGYNVIIPSRQVSGVPVYDRVEVLLPAGLQPGAPREIVVFRPTAGYSNLRIVDPQRPDTSPSSNVLRLGGAFRAARTEAPLHPRDLNATTATSWVSTMPWTDERLEQMSHRSVWTFRYFLAGNTGTRPDAVQHLTTVSRAPTTREALAMRGADLRPDDAARLLANARQRGIFRFSDAPLSSTAPFTLGWTVPDGALAPLSVSFWGRSTDTLPSADRPRFNVTANVRSVDRTATLGCPDRLAGTVHCDPAGGGRFSASAEVFNVELWSKNARQVELSRSWITFKAGPR